MTQMWKIETCGVEGQAIEEQWVMKPLKKHTVHKQWSARICRKQKDRYKAFHCGRSEISKLERSP